MQETGVKNFPRIMRYAFRVNDSLRIFDSPATTFTPLLPSNYSPHYPFIQSSQPYPIPYYQDDLKPRQSKEDDYFPFEGSIMSPIFPEELSKLLSMFIS